MRLKVILPLLVLAVALVGAFSLLATRETVVPKPPERRLPSVRLIAVQPESVELHVRSQGTVMPRTESQLISEVSGPVVWTSPALVSGGYFDTDQPLLRIERSRFETAVERARAQLGRAQGEFEFAEATLRRQTELAVDEIVSDSLFEEAIRGMSVARANLRDAEAALADAELDLARTEIRAPFRGRVREEGVDVGQFLNRGSAFATLYATDFLEVRLPIPDDELAFFEEPLWERQQVRLPEVRLHTRFAGAERSWWGRVVRTEGEIDPKSRMVHVIAQVENSVASGEEAPLPVGLFVQAEIGARTEDGIYVLPRSSLWDEGSVVVADAENRLHRRAIEILRVDQDEVLISSGLEPGERVCVSPPADLIEGQQIQPLLEEAGEEIVS